MAFATEVEIEQAVAVDVGPGGGLAGPEDVREAGFDRHVGEHAGAVVAQEAGAPGAVVVGPRAAGGEGVDVAVVVVVGDGEVQAARDGGHARSIGRIAEVAVAHGQEQLHADMRVDVAHQQVGEAVAVEVFGGGAAGDVRLVQAERRGDVGPGGDGVDAGDRLGRHQPGGLDAGRPRAERHARHVEQPLVRERAGRVLGEDLAEDRRRVGHALGDHVLGGLGEGRDARLAHAASHAVVELTLAHPAMLRWRRASSRRSGTEVSARATASVRSVMASLMSRNLRRSKPRVIRRSTRAVSDSTGSPSASRRRRMASPKYQSSDATRASAYATMSGATCGLGTLAAHSGRRGATSSGVVSVVSMTTGVSLSVSSPGPLG